jgi:hypothetical protein
MNWSCLLLLGVPVFGLEAMFLGLGGKVLVLYRKKRRLLLLGCCGAGLASILPSLVLSMWFKQGFLETCLALALSIGIVGWIVSLFSSRIEGGYQPPLPNIEKELEKLEKRFRTSRESASCQREA